MSIKGVGIDLTDIAIIKKAIDANKRFIQRVFTEDEIDYCENSVSRIESYAARFAAKEAFMKAIGTGWDKGIQWKDIEVVKNADGSVKLELHNKKLELFKECIFFLSISHTHANAIAIVIISY